MAMAIQASLRTTTREERAQARPGSAGQAVLETEESTCRRPGATTRASPTTLWMGYELAPHGLLHKGEEAPQEEKRRQIA